MALSLAAVATFSGTARGQAAAPVTPVAVAPIRQIVSISPISLVFGAFGAEYEARIGNSTSIGASATYYRPELFSYFSSEVKYRYYPQEKALEGFAVGLTGGLTQIGTHGTSNDDSGTAVSIGFALDYQWLLGPKKRFAVTLGTGARRLIAVGTSVDGAAVTLPTARISIGRGF